MKQQTLDILTRLKDYSEASFIVSASNAEAYQWVNAWPQWPSYLTVLQGPKGSGKTHLAHIWSQKPGDTAFVYDLQQMGFFFENTSKVVIRLTSYQFTFWNDDMDARLFHSLNAAKQAGAHVLLLIPCLLAQAPFRLPDLTSRLSQGVALRVHAPDDSLREALLSRLFSERQLRVSQPVMRYILRHGERSFEAMHALVGALDSCALQSARSITVGMVREVLSA